MADRASGSNSSERATNAVRMSAMLVRPDGIVAWASETTADEDGAARAALRWFGEPVTADDPGLRPTSGTSR